LAQNAFIREYGREKFDNYTSAIPYSVLESNNQLHVLGTVFSDGNSTETILRFLHTKIDPKGNIIKSNIDTVLYQNGYYHDGVFVKDFLYSVGVKWNKLPTREKKKIIQKIDKNGEIIWSKTFGDTSYNIYDNTIHKTYSDSNNFYVLSTGNDGISNTFDFSILDNEGVLTSIKQHKTSTAYPYLDRPLDSEQTSDGFLVLIEGSYGLPQAKYVYTLLKLDKQGNELWRKVMNDFPLPEREIVDSLQVASAVFKMQNDHFGVVFQLFRMDSLNQYLEISKTVLVEFDGEGNYIRSQGILEKTNFDIRKAESNTDGDIYIFGNTSGTVSGAFVAKVDENFDLVWSNFYGTETYNLYSNGCVTSDGGMAITGTRFRYSFPAGRNYFVVKTDCMGNTEWSSESCIIPREEEMVIMGNPMVDNLLIQFPQFTADETLAFKLYNSMGQLVMQRQINGPIISEKVSDLSAGMYLFKVQASSGQVFNGKLLKE
jgi:hypothetical protein